LALISFCVRSGRRTSALMSHSGLWSAVGSTGVYLTALELVGVLADAAALDVLELQEEGELLAIDAVLVVDEAGGVGQVTALPPRSRIFSTVYWATLPEPETRQVLPSRVSSRVVEHLGGEVDGAVAGGLGTDQRAAPVEALAGEHAGELVAELLVLAEQEADLAAAHADVAGGHVGVWPMWRKSSVMKLWQKRMTSLSLLPLGSKSEPPLPPPMGSVVRLFLKTCSKARNLRMPRLTVGWKRRPPL
jgi:hypothetical protein